MIRGEVLIARLDALPTLPGTAARLGTLLRDERATAADFEKVIRPDLALTANLLRAANSVFYRSAKEITGVRDAVARMGVRRVFAVAASASFRRVLPPRIPGFVLDVEAFWQHSVSTAIYCERLAIHTTRTIPDVAYTAGLLHDVGKLVIGTCLGESGAAVPLSALHTVQSEREALGVDHGDVGEEIALRWGLPSAVKDAARYHHEPALAPEGSDQKVAAMVHLADLLAGHSGRAGVPTQPVPAYDPAALARVGTTPEKLDQLRKDAEEEVRAVAAVTQAA